MVGERVWAWSVLAAVLAAGLVGCDPRLDAPGASPSASVSEGIPGRGADTAAAPDITVPPEVDLLEVTRMVNAGPGPASQFAPGSVTLGAPDPIVTPTATGWEARMPSGSPVATPAVWQGRVYVTGGFHSTTFHCLDAASGSPIWSVNLSDNGPSTAAVEDGVVVVNTESCTTFAMDAQTGEGKWSWFLGDPQMSAPAIAYGFSIASYPTHNTGVSSHAIAAIDLHSGAIRWQRFVDCEIISSPVAANGVLAAASMSGTLYTFDLLSGDPIAARHNRVSSAPTLVDNDIHFTRRSDAGAGDPVREAVAAWRDGEAKLADAQPGRVAVYLDRAVQSASALAGDSAQLDAAVGFGDGAGIPGAVLAAEHLGSASVATLQAFQSSRILHHDGRLFTTMGDTLFCLSAHTQQTLWQKKFDGDLRKAGGSLATAPALAGNRLVVATLEGQVLLIEPISGVVTRRYDVGAPIRQQPAIDSGRIYLGVTDGRVVCIDTGDPTLTGWPMWGGGPDRNAAR